MALRAFALTSGRDVVFDPALVRGKITHGVRGQFSGEDALRRLLAGSGLGLPQFTTIIIGATLPNGQPLPVSTVDQGEAGLKLKNATLQVAITGFYSHFNQLTATSGVVDPITGAVTNSSVVLNTTTIGIEG